MVSLGVGRKRERGATLFVVLMVMLMVSTIGIFAVSSARFEQRVAGYTRQRNAAFQMSDYGAFLVAQEVSGSKSQFYSSTIANSTVAAVSSSTPICSANMGLSGQSCIVRDTKAIESSLGSLLTGHLIVMASGGAPGSLGLTTLDGNFRVELTDYAVSGRILPGMAPSSACFIDMTVTSIGFVWQDLNLNNIIDIVERPTVSAATGRGQITVGPIVGGCH
jgi:hypothetical protein